ncbi:hypothetical protein OSB04_017892 [Centaurea solstitialis]|uniref:Major facilitator superfamily (MFS) profile domain-containing protein n=1 Tax=Centaurea solstitialis TaxID=347529 RepID=A0AA38WB22_9ASTR|nr:hypothetical protein OSB04_017892 [Centaurea solstitialis]
MTERRSCPRAEPFFGVRLQFRQFHGGSGHHRCHHGALCPGEDECSLAIYLTGIQQAVTGMGSLVMMPLIGNLSDHYGRKVLLTIPMMLATLPLGSQLASLTAPIPVHHGGVTGGMGAAQPSSPLRCGWP